MYTLGCKLSSCLFTTIVEGRNVYLQLTMPREGGCRFYILLRQ